ncbi:hypothetical protein [Catellatospora paridis]
MDRLPVRNVGDRVVCLFIEPLGMDYWMLPGDEFVVMGDPEAPDSGLSIDTMPDHVIILVNEGDCYNVTVHDRRTGAELECGHQRPAAG